MKKQIKFTNVQINAKRKMRNEMVGMEKRPDICCLVHALQHDALSTNTR